MCKCVLTAGTSKCVLNPERAQKDKENDPNLRILAQTVQKWRPVEVNRQKIKKG
jgi:hypothetical protein